jgi:hypothetical protein
VVVAIGKFSIEIAGDNWEELRQQFIKLAPTLGVEISAAQDAAPKAKKAKVKEQLAESSAPSPEPKTTMPTLEDLRELMKRVAAAGKIEDLGKLLGRHGYKKVVEVKSEDAGKLFAECQAILES